jgi:transposase
MFLKTTLTLMSFLMRCYTVSQITKELKVNKKSIYRLSQKWPTNGALRCRRDYRKRQKNVKKILLDLFSDLAVFESGI